MIYIQILFFFLFTLYLLYWIVLYWHISKTKISTNTNPNRSAQVEIIVAAHNEITNLKNLVPLLLLQDFPNLRITIVLDRPSDGSDQYLQTINDSRLNFLVIHSVPTEMHPKKYALDQAIRKSTAEYVLLTDADCIPSSSKWTQTMFNAIQNHDVCLGTSFYSKKPNFLNKFIQFETWMTAFQMLGLTALGNPYMALGRNFMYRRALYLDVNGFKHASQLGGDDDLFLQQIAPFAKITFCDLKESQTISVPKERFAEWWHQKQRHLHVGIHYPFTTLLLLSIYPMVTISTIVLFIVFCPQIWISVVLFCIFKFIIQFYVLKQLNKRWNQSISIFCFSILEILYISYIFIASIQARLFKIRSWQTTKS